MTSFGVFSLIFKQTVGVGEEGEQGEGEGIKTCVGGGRGGGGGNLQHQNAYIRSHYFLILTCLSHIKKTTFKYQSN